MRLNLSTYNIINKLLSPHDSINNLKVSQNLIKDLNLNPTYPIILIGGTNGKGSTCAYLTNILTLAGYKVGTYSSPHVFKYNERISINNKPINDNELENLLNLVTAQIGYNLGLFKTFTLVAHTFFVQQEIDIAIIEVGIGGSHDITNIFEPTISAITGVNYDHCDILGNTLDEIGLEKAGIYRKDKWAFFGSKNIPNSVINYANDISAKLQILGNDFNVVKNELSFDVIYGERKYYTLPYPSLRGSEQVYNAALALAIISKLQLQFPISLSTIKLAMLNTKLIGRFQIMPGKPQIIFDVAHNPEAVESMLQNMIKLPFVKNNIAVFGIAKDKDVISVIKSCSKSFDTWHIATLTSDRGLNSSEIKKIMLKCDIKMEQIIEHDNIQNAMQAATISAQENDRIVCFGSFLVVDDAYTIYLRGYNN